MATLISLTAQDGRDASLNRRSAERSYWRALGCASLARSALTSFADDSTRMPERGLAYLSEDVRADVAAHDRQCSIALEPVGARLDINSATVQQLALLCEQVLPPGLADSVALRIKSIRESIGSFRSAQTSTAAGGPAWSASSGDVESARFDDPAEVEARAALASQPRLLTILGVDSGRFTIRFAPREILRLIPGFDEPVVDEILHLRAVDSLPSSLLGLLGEMRGPLADTLLSHFPEAAHMAAIDPDAWLLTSTASDGRTAISASVRIRIVLSGRPTIQWERRTW